MIKKPSDIKIDIRPASSADQKEAHVVDSIIYRPTYEQVQIKTAFWHKFSTSPTVDLSAITLSTVQKFVSEPRLDRWWHVYGFKEWFLNEDEFAQRATSLAHMALDSLEDILSNPDANPSARVNAAKLAMEIANKMPQKWQKTLYLDDQIQKMDQSQLESYLRQKGLESGSKKED